jgi:hypothetical protein
MITRGTLGLCFGDLHSEDWHYGADNLVLNGEHIFELAGRSARHNDAHQSAVSYHWSKDVAVLS